MTGTPTTPGLDPQTYDALVQSEKCITLGPDCCFQWITGTGRKDGQRVGIIFWHRSNDGRACGGYVNFDPERNRETWTVEELDPLTISPSILCNGKHGCGGFHGFIRGGKWVSA